MSRLNDILNSGKLEAYVLGLLDQSEVVEVENWIAENPEVKAHVNALEVGIERVARDNKIKPHPATKTIIEKRLFNTNSNITTTVTTILSILGIAASILMAFLWYSANNEISELNTQYIALQQDCEQRKLAAQANEELLYFLRHEATVPVQLTNSNAADLLVYFNPVAQQSIIKIKELPQLNDNETYQLWADVDGKMVDMGIFPVNKSFIPVNYIENPESFNVTIEPSGGSKTPTVSRLVVSQKV